MVPLLRTGSTGIFRWDFGLSCQDTVPVADLIGERLALTIVMETCTIAFIWIVSFVIGVYAATHQYKLGDYVASFIGFVGLVDPELPAGAGAALCRQGLFRPVDRRPDGSRVHRAADELGQGRVGLQHLIIPVIVIGTSGTAGMIRRLRANLLDELQKQYVVTGRAKGLPPLKLLIKYPLRHAINPFVADIGGLLPR